MTISDNEKAVFRPRCRVETRLKDGQQLSMDRNFPPNKFVNHVGSEEDYSSIHVHHALFEPERLPDPYASVIEGLDYGTTPFRQKCEKLNRIRMTYVDLSSQSVYRILVDHDILSPSPFVISTYRTN